MLEALNWLLTRDACARLLVPTGELEFFSPAFLEVTEGGIELLGAGAKWMWI